MNHSNILAKHLVILTIKTQLFRGLRTLLGMNVMVIQHPSLMTLVSH